MVRLIACSVVLAAAVSGLGCRENTKEAPERLAAKDTSTVTTTQSASVTRKFLGAAECARPEFKSDERCDWYFDPMRTAEPGLTDAGK